MKVFHELAFEGYVQADGAAAQVTGHSRLMDLMGAVDVIHISGYSAQVSGTSPLLSILVLSSNDFSQWTTLSPAVINAVSLSTSGETLFQGVNTDPALSRLGYCNFLILLQGTGARAFLRIWVTGRDRSRRSGGIRHGAMAQPNAQMLVNPYGRQG